MGEQEIDTSSLSLTVSRGPPTAASGHAHLQVIKDGGNVGTVLAGGRDVTVLGRNSKMSHEVLDHQSISRRHAALVHNGDGDVFAADLGSTHGTYLNGCKIPAKTASRLKDGDVLKFGESSRYAPMITRPREVYNMFYAGQTAPYYCTISTSTGPLLHRLASKRSIMLVRLSVSAGL